MINKEIWRKKQLLKIMYTNKSFWKRAPTKRSTSSSTFDAGLYRYGSGMCYTDEIEPQEDFMFERKKSGNLNSSFNSSQRGISITPEMLTKSIQDEAREIEKLRNDVEELEEKIQIESECFDIYFHKFQEAKNVYEDRKGVIDDLVEFKNWLEGQIDALHESLQQTKDSILKKFIEDIYSVYYYEYENN